MNCVDMIDSLNSCINLSNKNYNSCIREHSQKKRKRDDNIVRLNENDYLQTIQLLNQMNEKIELLEEKIKNLEDDITQKNELLNNINKNYLTKESIKKIKIYSNIELSSEYDYYS